MGNNRDCPCSTCEPPKRQLGCHGNCAEYKVWRTKMDGIRDKMLKDREYYGYIHDTVAKKAHEESRKAK